MNTSVKLNFGNSTLGQLELRVESTANGIIKWQSGSHPDFIFFSIDGVIDQSSDEYIAVNMHIPSFFENVDRSYNGMFLFKASKNPSITNIRSMKLGVGKYGCPQTLNLDPAPSFFEFNSNYFHPFVLKDMTVAYYVSEQRYHNDWMLGLTKGYSQIAVNLPIEYDPLLALFVTRDAKLEPDKIREEFSETIAN